MATRGIFGFRKNGEDKLTYNHCDSYPDGLGRNIIEFINKHSVEELNDTFDKIVLVNEHTPPTEKQIQICIKNGLSDFSVSSGQKTDWYCLLRNCQGDLESLVSMEDEAYMIDNRDFIKDSLFCEYGYIINLDDNVLEYWEGFQYEPDPDNRYGTEHYGEYEDMFYPCKLIHTFSFDQLDDVDTIIELMNEEENDEIIGF